MSVLDEGGHVLASPVITLPGRANSQAPITHDVPFTPSSNGVVLRGAPVTDLGVQAMKLGVFLVVALAIATLRFRKRLD